MLLLSACAGAVPLLNGSAPAEPTPNSLNADTEPTAAESDAVVAPATEIPATAAARKITPTALPPTSASPTEAAGFEPAFDPNDTDAEDNNLSPTPTSNPEATVTTQNTAAADGPVFIDEVQLLAAMSEPPQLTAVVEGNLPSPCHTLVATDPVFSTGRIDVSLRSAADPDLNCIQVLEPFVHNISLGVIPDGDYTLYINNEAYDAVKGSGTSAAAPPTSAAGAVYLSAWQLNILESWPLQINLIVSGELPNGCAILGHSVTEDAANGIINVRVFSDTNPDLICTEALVPFDELIDLGSYSSGSWKVILNDDIDAGSFTAASDS